MRPNPPSGLINVAEAGGFMLKSGIMHEDQTAKCSCIHCAIHLEFPLAMEGAEIECPTCSQRTVLSAGLTAGFEATGLGIAEIVQAFAGPLRKTRVSFFYTAGLCLVAIMMLLLPVVYVFMIGGAGWLTYLWGIQAAGLLRYNIGGFYLYMAQLLLYVTPLFAGIVLVTFMVKPIFARRAPCAQPLALNREAEPLLFAFVNEVCQAVRAPLPRRIDVNCQLNASAGFRRGFWSFLGHDLVLTVGLPLVAGFNTRQFAGIVAHEFGHFTQGAGMRLTYVIRTVNGWFMRVVYERDSWDLALKELAESHEWRLAIIASIARLGVWFSRLLLTGLMLVGHAVGCFMLRQMEFDADSYAIKLAGSKAFEEITARMRLLSYAMDRSYKDLRTKWNINRALPEDFPDYFLDHHAQTPESIQTQLLDRLGMARTRWFDTHPADADRIRAARQAAEPGILSLTSSATNLFSNFAALSRQVTLLHYADDLGIPVQMATFHRRTKPAGHLA
jgi:Zn-dependent protease with chaperone function